MAGSNYTVINAASVAVGSGPSTPVNQAVVHQLCSIDIVITNGSTAQKSGAFVDVFFVCTAQTYTNTNVQKQLGCLQKVRCELGNLPASEVRTFKSGGFIVDGTSVWIFYAAQLLSGSVSLTAYLFEIAL